MSNRFQRKQNIKKVLIASMFASTILGAEQVLAEENEPLVSQTDGTVDSLNSLDELLQKTIGSDVSEQEISDLHKGISYHLDNQYEQATKTYNDLLDIDSSDNQWNDLIKTLRTLSLENVELNEESITQSELFNTDFTEIMLVILEVNEELSESNELEEDKSDDLDDSEPKENTKEIAEEESESNELEKKDEKTQLEDDEEKADSTKTTDSEELSENKTKSEIDDTDEGDEKDSTLDDKVEEENIANEKEEKEQSVETFSVQTSSTRPSANTLYNNTMNASTASRAWNYANEFNKHYPNDYRIKEAFDSASNRIFSLAQSNHRSRNYSTANRLYNQLRNEPHVPSNIKTSLSTLIDMANSQVRLGFASTYYNNVMTANTATNAWTAAMEFKGLYPTDSQLTEAVNSAGQRILAMGRSSQRSNRFELAKHYYTLLLEEELINQGILDDALVGYSEVNSELNTSETDLFYETINASSATEAWNNLGRLIARFPNHSRMSEAVEHASARIYAMGRSNHLAGRQGTAELYYSWLIQESRVNQNLKTLASAHLAQLDNGWEFRTAEDYFKDSTAASTASEAWAIATEGIALFPNDLEVQAGLNSAADRIYSLGKSNHRRGNFNTSLIYYNQIISQDGVLPGVKAEAQVFSRQAEDRKDLTTANQFFNQSISAGTASQAWNIANEGLSYYPNHSKITEALHSAADRVLALGENNHKRGRFSTALTYYNRLLGNDYITHAMRTRVESYRYLADNDLYLTNMIVRESVYTSSFDDAVDKQMALRAKPQASHNGGWRDASREEVIRHMDPENILPSDMSDLTNMFTTARIIVDVLNVRSGPGTTNSIVGTVTRGQEFTIIAEQSGWYKIGYNGSEAWISGSSNHVSANREMLQFLNLEGSVGVSIENLNRELRNAGILEGQGEAFRQASIEANVNEIYLISHAILETGRGTSRLATGVLVDEVDGEKVTPKVVYNMFGIGAVDHAPIKLGAERAYKEGWFTPEASIIEGAKWISRSYVNHATHQQNTLYKMRWNPASPGTHQYATDVGWASKQTSMLRSIIGYSLMDNLVLNFDIPNYQ